jgi:hypothetical protein
LACVEYSGAAGGSRQTIHKSGPCCMYAGTVIEIVEFLFQKVSRDGVSGPFRKRIKNLLTLVGHGDFAPPSRVTLEIIYLQCQKNLVADVFDMLLVIPSGIFTAMTLHSLFSYLRTTFSRHLQRSPHP